MPITPPAKTTLSAVKRWLWLFFGGIERSASTVFQQGLVDQLFTFDVDLVGRFVEDQDLGIA